VPASSFRERGPPELGCSCGRAARSGCGTGFSSFCRSPEVSTQPGPCSASPESTGASSGVAVLPPGILSGLPQLRSCTRLVWSYRTIADPKRRLTGASFECSQKCLRHQRACAHNWQAKRSRKGKIRSGNVKSRVPIFRGEIETCQGRASHRSIGMSFIGDATETSPTA
jgi:hypothetical protein